MKRIVLALLLTSALVVQTACATNFATDLRLALAAGAPILSLLVQQGKLSPALKDGLVTDLSNEALRVGDLATCFSAISSGDAQSKLKHLQCVQTLDSSADTKKLLSDFGTNPTVLNIADDIEAIIQGAILFYGGQLKAAARRSSVPLPATEKAIQSRIEQLKRDLGQQ